MRKRYRIRANKMPGDRFWAHYGHFQPNIGKNYSIFGWNPAKIDHIALKQKQKKVKAGILLARIWFIVWSVVLLSFLLEYPNLVIFLHKNQHA